MLIDINVLVDFALDREEFGPIAETLLNRIEQTSTTAFVAWHSIATFHFLVTRGTDRATARAFVVRLTNFLTVVSTGHANLDYALSLPMRDFEDAMQVAAARAAGVERIVTRDARDFANSPIPAITPEQALQELF
ncbi:MAG: PIN domain-containing protein [Chloroflexota bacterium]|nr:PIN domain-containing protein [Chloroflexota bacterium]MDE2962066.1 PIN domain-containing protein [Chloroflexota bacterium]